MRKIVSMLGILSVSSVLAFADDFQGRLIDASCYQQQKSATTCDPSSTTSSYMLYVGDTAYTLDTAGNQKVATAMKTRADRSTDPTKATGKQVMAKVTGTKDAGNTLKVDTVDIQ